MSDDRDLPMPSGDHTPSTSFSSLLEHHGLAPRWDLSGDAAPELADATTVLGLRYGDGVVMIGDRQATAGHAIAHRRMQKVFAADRFSAVAISGTAGIATELIRLFQTELEHYEKLEGTRLSLEGKANYLSRMIRGHLSLAMQGLAVVPLFGGYDELERRGRIYTFDVVGGRYEEQEFAATGSGSPEALAYLRTMYQPDLETTPAIELGIAALVAAAEQDTATGGPDLRRDILPTVVTITDEGYGEVSNDVIREISERALENVR